MRPSLEVGSIAPDFEAQDQLARVVRLSALRGYWVVLYFYPKDRTLGCTAEACAFRNHFDELQDQGAIVLGVSRDDIESHSHFAERRQLPFPLLADPEGEILRLYEAQGFFGLARRMTYVIDPAGRIAKVYRFVSAPWHAKQVLADLRDLRLSYAERQPKRALVTA